VSFQHRFSSDLAQRQPTAHHLLGYIALHVNRPTGEAFELSVDRLAHRLDVTPQWVRHLRTYLVAAGELEIQQSRGRRPNVYRISYERCPACRAGNPKLEWPVEGNPQQSPAQPETQPETAMSPTRNWKGYRSRVLPGSRSRKTTFRKTKEQTTLT
jgi:hypothetical protein